MASLKFKEEPITSFGLKQLMEFGKPKLQYRNASIASAIPSRYLRLANSNLKQFSSQKEKTDYKDRLLTFVTDSRFFLSMNDSELCDLAKSLSSHYESWLAVKKLSFSSLSSDISSCDDFWSTAYSELNTIFKYQGFPSLPKPSSKTNYYSSCLRSRSIKYWRRVLRVTQARIIETEHFRMGEVGRKTRQLYISNESLKHQNDKRLRNERLLESLEAVNEEGYTASLLELSNVTTSNPELRRNELMTRLRGLEEFADSQGLVGDFITITCPSRFHRYTALYKSGNYVTSILNLNFDGSTPRQAQVYLNKQWSKMRAELKRQDLSLLGMRVAEPHQDGCPHWHILLFVEPSDMKAIRSIFRHYSLEDSPYEKGAQKHRFTAKKINKKSKTGKKQSAVGYIAKYIAKNLSFDNKSSKTTNGNESLPIDSFENDGQPVKESVNRVQAWSSLWGIRQFQQFGGERITVWRELRRIRQKDDVPASFDSIHTSADSGNYADFLKQSLKQKISIVTNFDSLSNRPTVDILDDSTGQIITYPDHNYTNLYDELKPPKIIGLQILTDFMRTRAHEWRLKLKRVSALGLVSITVPSLSLYQS